MGKKLYHGVDVSMFLESTKNYQTRLSVGLLYLVLIYTDSLAYEAKYQPTMQCCEGSHMKMV